MKDFYIYDYVAVNYGEVGKVSWPWRYLTKLDGADYIVVDASDVGLEPREGELALVPIDASKIVTDPEPWETDVISRLKEPLDFTKMIRVQGILHSRDVWPPETEASS